jgi:hypothetical protein
MRLICAKCGHVFESLIIDKEIAWQDVSKQSVDHVRKSHRAIAENLAKTVTIASINLAVVAHATEFLVIPEEEEFCQAKVSNAIETVMTAIGFDPSEIEEEETEDEEETGNDGNGGKEVKEVKEGAD